MFCWLLEPPVIGLATPNEGRPAVSPGFLPNALTAFRSNIAGYFEKLGYREMVNKSVMLCFGNPSVQASKRLFNWVMGP